MVFPVVENAGGAAADSEDAAAPDAPEPPAGGDKPGDPKPT
jgi:hypothetical protein